MFCVVKAPAHKLVAGRIRVGHEPQRCPSFALRVLPDEASPIRIPQDTDAATQVDCLSHVIVCCLSHAGIRSPIVMVAGIHNHTPNLTKVLIESPPKMYPPTLRGLYNGKQFSTHMSEVW